MLLIYSEKLESRDVSMFFLSINILQPLSTNHIHPSLLFLSPSLPFSPSLFRFSLSLLGSSQAL